MIRFEQVRQLGLIILDRPSALNALSKDMIIEIYHMLLQWSADQQIKAVVIRSSSPTVFCAGGDIRSVYLLREESLENKIHFFSIEYHLNYLLSVYNKPIISLINGLCMGGGVGLGMHLAFPIAGENMRFSMPETAIGLFPDVGASALLNRLDRSLQNYLGVFAQSLDSSTLEFYHLVYDIIPTAQWENLMQSLADCPWQEPADISVKHILSQYAAPKKRSNPKTPLSEFWRFDTNDFAHLMQNIEEAEGEDWMKFRDQIKKLSPLSMQVSFEQLRRAQGFNLAQALEQDFILLQHFLVHPEFYEGIRALLIDKDKHPHWTYQHWFDVPKPIIQSFFENYSHSLNLKNPPA